MAELAARSNHRRVIGKRLVNGESTLLEELEKDSGLLFGYKKLKADLHEVQLDRVSARPTLPSIEFPIDTIIPLQTDKLRHYWFYSTSPDRGKTTFLIRLAETARCTWYNRSEIY